MGRIRTCEAEAADLQSAGFDRSPTPPIRMGILLLHMKDVNEKSLNREKILSFLDINQNQRVNLEVFNQIDSTNSYLLKKDQEIDVFNVCAAEMQTKGRGRSGKSWESPKNSNIYFSIGTLLNETISDLDGFSILVALDIKKALKKLYEINSQIKWPNDLYLNEKKFGGILIETKIVNKKLLIIIGIGLNVYMEKNDFIDQEWTSLHLENPSIEIDRNILISQIVSEIAKDLNIFLKKGFKVFKKDFEKINILKNKKVFVSNYSEANCIALDTNDDGSLNILVDNVKKRVSSGEVSLKIQK